MIGQGVRALAVMLLGCTPSGLAQTTVPPRVASYTTVVIAVDEHTLGGLRRAMSTTTTAASDLETLIALNEDYVRSVQASNAKRFDKILAEDSLCSLPDGTLLGRKQFLEGEGRYTDVWARRNGQWLAVAAHVTRKQAS
jgi:hypothetical protein